MSSDAPKRISVCANTPSGGPAHYGPPKVDPNLEPGTRAAMADVRWESKTIMVGFTDGKDAWGKKLRDQVKRLAPMWSQYAGVTFEFVEGFTNDVSIAFEPNAHADYGTYSSYLGTDSRMFSRTHRPSMYLVFDPNDANNTDLEFQRVIVHEFGHALGLIHEHMRPDRPIVWNQQAVYDYYHKSDRLGLAHDRGPGHQPVQSQHHRQDSLRPPVDHDVPLPGRSGEVRRRD